MISLFRNNPIKKLSRQYKKLMKEARDIQRSGDLKLYAQKINEAEEIAEQIQAMKSK